MAIMQSCCCWQSVRRGSYACAIYTGIYFIILAITTATVLQAESEYLSGNRSLPESSSFLEVDTISPATVRFNITFLICSCSGVICTILLVYGLLKPNFNPITAMLYTLNFFLLCLNVPVVRYAVQPTTTATSCLSSRRAPTNNETKATPTPTQSPTAVRTVLSCPEKSPTVGRANKKHVQFPDTPTPTSSSTPTAIPMSLEKSEIPLTDSNAKYTLDVGVSLEKR
ncbi:uncharacterized protein LOC124952167 isoform X6 [Vespa velutina]|uniref:uncharacterized protein LOC124952167 isoform X6 n=1 Tax=Vespa velutina TaxID=202808 RepID=UPI001FB351E5|nr:uncharacterized protein LOC124952167 isoform X6 [Vespa velutina]